MTSARHCVTGHGAAYGEVQTERFLKVVLGVIQHLLQAPEGNKPVNLTLTTLCWIKSVITFHLLICNLSLNSE